MSEPVLNASVSYSATVRVSIQNKPGSLARVLGVIGEKGGQMAAIDLVEVSSRSSIRDLTILSRDDEHMESILRALRRTESVKVLRWWDRVFRSHQGGKIEIRNRVPVRTRDDLSIVYTPGVARVCTLIHEQPSRVNGLTVKGNSVAIVTDGTAVLGLGDIGPEAALPVMEGKAMLFKEFADIDAWPICLATRDVDEIVRTVECIAPGFGGINLEDISSPRCFEIEEKLKERLNIPVFHDDQHGTAVVVLAALINALKLTGIKADELRVVVCGTGAAGVACAKIMYGYGVRDIVGVDLAGVVHEGHLNDPGAGKRWFAEHTNPDGVRGGIVEACMGRHMFLGLSGPGALPLEALKKMAPQPIVFALANPTPEIMPEVAASHARIIATGRSDYPNQINNVLAFPGIFKGALEARATTINEAMKIAAACAIAACIPDSQLFEEFIVPSVFDKHVARAVRRAVRKAAVDTGVGR